MIGEGKGEKAKCMKIKDFSPEADAVFQTQIPGHVDDLRVEGEWYAESGQQDVSHREVHQQVMPRVPAPASAQRADYEEEVAEDGNGDGDDIQRDPSPLVFVLQQVAGHLGEDVVAHSGVQACLWIDTLGGD